MPQALVCYYSHSHNTEKMAVRIAALTKKLFG
jgi:flavodoxin